ncbi:MAG: hypothetical protein ACSHX3_12115 [Litorimonas sp.]
MSENVHQQIANVSDSKDRIIKGALAKSVTSPLQETLEVLSKRSLAFAQLTGSKSWIIGSSPHVRFSNGGTDSLYDLRTELWLPISYDIAVSPGPYLAPKEAGVFILDDTHHKVIQTFNNSIFRQSSEVASQSPTLLRALASRHGMKNISIKYRN